MVMAGQMAVKTVATRTVPMDDMKVWMWADWIVDKMAVLLADVKVVL